MVSFWAHYITFHKLPFLSFLKKNKKKKKNLTHAFKNLVLKWIAPKNIGIANI